ncbi:translation initiation factor [Salibacteraceae bacterium]|nr:translation initiation factor [Crocinitomicaceae bacterium]MDA9968027.1 translation initiation factor [Salibacteraceae bacterium]MDC1204119.1 translation initiation factor [Salibacteraceae bacterium]|tara:strand:+ start:101932 stop:102282 length:351 start_codon:yes stop_codon:yes gene_type:complete
MGKNKKSKERVNVVYSTNSDYSYESENDNEQETLPPNEQVLRVYIEKKGRGGKTASVLKGFIGSDEDRNDLSKMIKASCGVGGTVKDGEIIIQGDQRDKIVKLLSAKNYGIKKAGG